MLVYSFDNDICFRAEYFFHNVYSDPNENIKDYEKFNRALNSKYGSTYREDLIWTNENFKLDNPDEYAEAVEVGLLGMYCEWRTDRTKLSNLLFGENYKCYMIIRYESLNPIEVESTPEEDKQDLGNGL